LIKKAYSRHVEIYRDLTRSASFSQAAEDRKACELGQMVTGIAHESATRSPASSVTRRPLLRRDSLGGSHEARQISRSGARQRYPAATFAFRRDSRPSGVALRLIRVVTRTLELSASTPQPRISRELDLDPVLRSQRRIRATPASPDEPDRESRHAIEAQVKAALSG